VCKLYLLFLSADAEKKKKEKKVLLPTGVSKSTAHTVYYEEREDGCEQATVACVVRFLSALIDPS
jgi:hypothetical protein